MCACLHITCHCTVSHTNNAIHTFGQTVASAAHFHKSMWQCNAPLRTQTARISPPDRFERPSRLGKENRCKLFSHYKCLHLPHNTVSRAACCPRVAGWADLPHSVCDVSMTVCVRSRISIQFCYTEQNKVRLRYTEVYLCLLYCVGVKLGRSH